MHFAIRGYAASWLVALIAMAFPTAAHAVNVKIPELVTIPPGTFEMGTPRWAKKPSSSYGAAQHTVTIGYEFQIGKYEVTREEWDDCVNEDVCPEPKFQLKPGGRIPVHGVSFDDIEVYMKWLSHRTGRNFRLPSEAEWEYAARGGSTGIYATGSRLRPWQANFHSECDPDLSDYHDCLEAQGGEQQNREAEIFEVGQFDANGFGLHDVHGNLYEGTADCLNKTYDGAPNDGSAWTEGDCTSRIIRGGSYVHSVFSQRVDHRMADGVLGWSRIIGFRVAVSD
jgi:formylglycine-generating enzyme required for sulfatase activity